LIRGVQLGPQVPRTSPVGDTAINNIMYDVKTPYKYFSQHT